MERRKLLIGSGAALATVVAGCSSSETGDEDPDTGSSGDGNGDENGHENGTENGDEKDDGEKGEKSHGKRDEIPGFDESIELDSDVLSIHRLERDGKTVTVGVETTTTKRKKLYREVKRLCDDVTDAVEDKRRFAKKIDVVEAYLVYDGEKVLEATIKVKWIRKYLEGDYSREKLEKKVRETCR